MTTIFLEKKEHIKDMKGMSGRLVGGVILSHKPLYLYSPLAIQ